MWVCAARHAIIFNTRLSPKAKLLMCTPGGLGSGGMCACFTGAPCCNIIQWDKLNARSYVRVYENSVQANYATTIFCGACIADVVFTSHMDKVPASMMHAKMCTPFLLCCCIQIAGDTNPVTRQLAGSAYHLHLSKQMAEFLPPLLDRSGGMMLLTDVYCLVNRARGTQLISPQDCLTACAMFEQLDATSLRLKEFASGVKAVVADARTEANIAARIEKQLQDEEAEAAAANKLAAATVAGPVCLYASISPLRLSNSWPISIVLAKQDLQTAEQLQLLCRDESTHGLAFALNHFAAFAAHTNLLPNVAAAPNASAGAMAMQLS